MLVIANSLSESERWIYGLLLLAVITWNGHWLAQRLNHALAIRRECGSRLASAAATFRAAIDPSVFAELRGHPLHGALIKVFPNHLAAAHEFRRYLGPIDRWRFSRAWKAYHGGSEDHPNWFPRYCVPYGGPELLVQRLEALRSAVSQT